MPLSHYPELVVAYHADTAPRRQIWSAFRVFLRGETTGRLFPRASEAAGEA